MASMEKFKHIILAVAIAVVLVFFIGFGIATFYPEPKYEDFCIIRDFQQITTKEECEAEDGKWTDRTPKPLPVEIERVAKPATAESVSNMLVCTIIDQSIDNRTLNCQTVKQFIEQGYCDLEFYCRKDFDDRRENYNRNVFIAATGLGIIVLIVGFALGMPSVSAGLMGGGVLSIIYGTIRFWSDLPDYGRFIILGIALAILVWLGYKRLKQ